jgi:hypothetical protein
LRLNLGLVMTRTIQRVLTILEEQLSTAHLIAVSVTLIAYENFL